MDEDLKQIWRSLWHDKPLLITVAVGLGFVIFLIIRNRATPVSSAPAATTAAMPSGATYVENSYSSYVGPVTTTNTTSTSGQPATFPPNPSPLHAPGTTYLGPSGVKHYVALGTQTLTQIAQHFGLASWNSIYAIPDNQKLFGRLSATKAKAYTPARGISITLPGNTTAGF
jgi:hypothetical protein